MGKYGHTMVVCETQGQRCKRNAAARPAVSLTLYDGNDLAIIAHGHAAIIADGEPDFAALEALQRATDGTSVRDWGDGVYLRITATVLYTYARQPERYPAGRSATAP